MAGLLGKPPLVPPADDSEDFDPNKFLRMAPPKKAVAETADDEFDPNSFLSISATPQGELPAGARSALGFLSNDAEKRRYLSKKYPGIKFGKWKDQDVVYIPGETTPRYVDDPSLTFADIADFAGDAPGVVGGVAGGALGTGAAPGAGTVAGAAAGAAAGEAARKAIGRKFILGEDVIQEGQIGQDLTDIGIAGAAGAIGQGVSNVVTKQLAKRAGQKAIEDIGKNTAKKVIAGEIAESSGLETGKQAARSAGAQEATGIIRGELRQELNPVDEAGEIALKREAPKDMGELVARHEADSAKGLVPDLPSAQRLREIEETLPDLENKPLGIHREMLKSKQNYDMVRVRYKELPSKEREALDAYEQRMKAEIERKIGGLIDEGGTRPALPRTDAGNNLIAEVGEIYKANKTRLGPVFQKFNEVPINEGQHIQGLTNRLAEEVPGFGQALRINQETGKLELGKFRPDMGVSRKAYAKMGEVVRSLNEEKLSFRQMQQIREYLRKEIDPAKPGETADLQAIRKAMLNHMEDLVNESAPDLEVRKTFQEYAKNERFLENFEQILGGKIENINALYNANPDAVLNKVFANPNTVKIAREGLGEQRFNNLVADFVGDLKARATDSAKNTTSMARLAQDIKRRRGVLVEAMGEEKVRRLEALTDLGRIIPDAPPVNPSGTAKTSVWASIIRGGKKITSVISGGTVGDPETVAKALDDAKSTKEAIKYFNEIMAAAPKEKQGELAAKLLPYAKSKTAKAFLQGKVAQPAGALKKSLRGPEDDRGLLQPTIQGPGGEE